MFVHTADRAFRRFKATGDPAALARVFDKTAPELLPLARHLASGEAAAEDLLQATFVTAIESAHDHQDGRPVLPWLVGVLGNHARAARRRGRRAVDPERLRAEVTHDPVAEAQGRELEESLRDRVAELPEVYRPVLRLYLEHGLEPAEIARTLERPQGTVRAQISRGLEALRRALPAGLTAGVGAVAVTSVTAAAPGRGLAAVRAAVLRRCGEQAGGRLAAASTLGVLAIMNQKLVTFAAAAVAVAALGWSAFDLFGDAGDASSAERVSAASAALPPPSPGDADAHPVPQPDSDGARTAVPDAATVTATDAAPTDGAALRVIVRRARDGAAAAGIGVWLCPFDRLQDRSARTAVRRTDAAGSVRFDGLEPVQVVVLCDRGDSLRAVELESGAERTVEVELPVAVTVEGTVSDHHGSVVPGARILAHGTHPEPLELARTDARGRYRIEDVARHLGIQARKPGHVPSLGHRVAGDVGSTVRVDLRLTGRGRLVVGEVRDADGAPAAGALVAVLPRVAGRADAAAPQHRAVFARTDGSGAFRLDEVGAGEQVVFAEPRERGRHAPGAAPLAAGEGDAFVAVTLRRGAVLEGRVVEGSADDGDRPLARVHVVAWPHEPDDDIGYLLNTFGIRQATTDADGGYRLTGLVPGEYQLSANHGRKLADGLLRIGAGEQHRWDVRVGTAASLALRFSPPLPAQLEPGTPGETRFLPMWLVRLYRCSEGGNVFVNAGSVAAHDGVLRFTDVARGEYEVVVSCQVDRTGRNTVDVLRQTVRVPSVGPITLEIPDENMPRAHVVGRLLDASGSPVANVTVRAVHRGDGPAFGVEAFSDAAGRFRIGPLPRGSYGIMVGSAPSVRFAGAHEVLRDRVDIGDVRVATGR